MSRIDGELQSRHESAVAPPIIRAPLGMAQAPAPPQIAIDADGRIAEEILCRRCGYNLRGLALQGVCPECSTSVARSVQGDLLRLSDPKWVERLAAGTLWVIIGLLGGVVLGIAMGLGGALWGASQRSVNMNMVTSLGMVVGTVMATVQVIGYWLVTSPDPGAPPDTGLSARTVARFALMFVIVAAASQGLIGSVSGATQTPGGAWLSVLGSATGRNLILAAATLSIVLQTIGYFALFRYASVLGLRIPHPSLAWQAKVVMWGYATMQVLSLITTVLIFQALPALIGPGGIGTGGGTAGLGPALPWLVASGIVGCVSAPVALTFQIWAIILLFRFGSQFRKAAAQARVTWAIDL